MNIHGKARIGVAALGCLVIAMGATRGPARGEPATLDEVIRIAKRQGLHCRMEGLLESTKRLIVSAKTLSDDEAESVSPHRKLPEVVTCYFPGDKYLHNWEDGNSLVWGNVFLIGDPALIATLTGRPVNQSSRPLTSRGL